MAITIGTGSIEFDGGTAFRAADVSDLRAGKSIASNTEKQFRNSVDDTTYIRMGSAGKAWHYIDNAPVLKLGIGAIIMGNTNTKIEIGTAGISGGNGGARPLKVSGSGGLTVVGPTVLQGFEASGDSQVSGSLTISGSNIAGSPPALMITGSTEFTGSTTVDGPFGVGNLLDLLANYGTAGIPTGSGEGGVSVGDINLDGQVNINDLLLLLAGYGNSQCIVSDLTIPQNTNYQLVGPEISICEGITVTVGTNSFLQIT